MNRIVLKLSGEALEQKQKNRVYDDEIFIPRVVREVKTLMEQNFQISIVVGGGNFWRGRDSGHEFKNQTKSDRIGMLATVMNAIFLSECFEREAIQAVVQTPFSIYDFTEMFSIETANEHLNQNKVVIFAGGLGHPFFSTDTICAVRACQLKNGANIKVLMAKNGTRGIYNKDPRGYTKEAIWGARVATEEQLLAEGTFYHNDEFIFFEEISYAGIIKLYLGAFDIAAAHILKEQQVPSVVFDCDIQGSIIEAALGKKIGTNIIL